MGPHSDWPYPTGDPLPSEDEMKSQAGLMFAELCNGKSVTKIAKEYGVDRSTVYARLKLISPRLPEKSSLRAINFARSERLIEQLGDQLGDDSELAVPDLVKVSGEIRQLLDRQAAWFRLAEEEPAAADENTAISDDDWEAREL